MQLFGAPADPFRRRRLKVLKKFLAFPLLLAITAEAQISGPAVLGNGSINSRRSGELVSIRPYASLNGTYSGGLTPSGTDANGDPVYDSSYGASASGGVSGYHSWKRSVLNLSYNANSSYYGKTPRVHRL